MCSFTLRGAMVPRKELEMKITCDLQYLPFSLSTESAPLDSSMSTPSSYPSVNEMFGRKRKKRTSIETNIRSTLEKRFQDVRRERFNVLGALHHFSVCFDSRLGACLGRCLLAPLLFGSCWTAPVGAGRSQALLQWVLPNHSESGDFHFLNMKVFKKKSLQRVNRAFSQLGYIIH